MATAGDDHRTITRKYHFQGKLVACQHFPCRFRLKVGDRIDIVPEPTNFKDKHAMKVVWKGETAGYIKNANTPTNVLLSKLLKKGYIELPLSGIITRLNTNFTGGSIDLDVIIKKEADQKVKERLGKHNIEEVEMKEDTLEDKKGCAEDDPVMEPTAKRRKNEK